MGLVSLRTMSSDRRCTAGRSRARLWASTPSTVGSPPPLLHTSPAPRVASPAVAEAEKPFSHLPQLFFLLRPLALGDAGEGRPPPCQLLGARLEEGGRGQAVYFRCIRSGTFKGRCHFGVNKYRRASTPSKVREACTSSVLPTTRQTRTKASQRRVERGREIAKDLLRRDKSQWWSNPNRKWDSFRLCPAKSLGQRRARQGQERWTSVKKLARRCRR